MYIFIWLIGKDPNAGKDWRQEEKGTTDDEMVGWHHWLNGHEFEQAPGVGDRLGSLACCSHKESDTTEWLNWWSSLSYSQCRNVKKKKRIINPSLLKCACALAEENFSMRCWDHQICSSTMAMPLTYFVWPDKSRESLFFHLRLYGLVFTKPCIASHGTFFKSGCVFPSRRPWLISVALILLLFSRQVMSNSLQPHGLRHARFPCPSETPGVCSDSCPLSWWSHPTISSSVAPFSSCPQSFPASGSFPVRWLSHHVARVLRLQHQHVMGTGLEQWALSWGWLRRRFSAGGWFFNVCAFRMNFWSIGFRF